ncbi:hypothetical protein C2E20_7579 [Micractinium conductrix]|uniref:C2 NT-type domain-containing protein n=1 Tax=Micractinium conductrix TaxID=554055 RepID=A0A2P6V462_9CHLO|nr:hypothetical protein C2E20_7579 [Micractinium conductrix]|eukprot:PSC68867.1 hypothetical protein C2E20_7579 [Micractinium conductrix]
MNRQGLTYEVEVVAQHAAELPLPAGASAQFVLKRRNRLCLTEPEAVGASGDVEWNTRCTQTATLFKNGDSWRPKEFVLKVQAVKGSAEEAQTVAKAAIDLSQFCMPEPLGPKQLVVPLQPCGVLSISIRTRWLQFFKQETDSLTDVSYLSLSAMPSTVSVPLQAEDQDLSGFDGGAPQDGSIKAAWGAAGAGAAGAAPLPGGVLTEKKRSLVSATFRLPRRGSAVDPQQQQEQQQQGGKGAQLLRAATLPSMALGGATAGSTPSRRPAGASLLLIPGGGSADAATPTMVGQQAQQGQAVAAAAGQPPEEWSPVDLQEAVKTIYDSDEEPTPKPTVLGTVKRFMLNGRARNGTLEVPGTSTRQALHATFNTPQSLAPHCTPNPSEMGAVDRGGAGTPPSVLRRRCKQLRAERDEARAEGYAEATVAVQLGLEIDRLKRAKDMLLQRLQVTEQQLLATYRDEASTDLIQALAAARVEAADKDFRILELEHDLRRKAATVDKLRAALTRAEAKYRSTMNEALTPGKAVPPSPWSAASSPNGEAAERRRPAAENSPLALPMLPRAARGV